MKKERMRNQKCICFSGKKFKNCHRGILKENDIFELINLKDYYCYCGSRNKFSKCCKKNKKVWEKSQLKFIDFLEKSKKNPNKEDLLVALGMEKNYYLTFWEENTNNTCISPGCNRKSINSHLLSKSYLKQFKENILIGGEKINSDGVKTLLFCEKCDTKLFLKTDSIKNFKDITYSPNSSNREFFEIISEWFKKVLSFKYKNSSLDLMKKYIIGKFDEKFIEIFWRYNKICETFDKFYSSREYAAFANGTVKSGKVENVYEFNSVSYSTIVFPKNLVKEGIFSPFLIIFNSAENTISYYIGTYEEESFDPKIKKYIDETRKILSNISKNQRIEELVYFFDEESKGEVILITNKSKHFFYAMGHN